MARLLARLLFLVVFPLYVSAAEIVDPLAAVAIVRSASNPGVQEYIVKRLEQRLYAELIAGNHFNLPLAVETQNENDATSSAALAQRTSMWRDEDSFINSLFLDFRVDGIVRVSCSNFASKYILQLWLYTAQTRHPGNPVKTVKKIGSKADFNSTKFLRDSLEELFFPANIFTPRGFVDLPKELLGATLWVEGEPVKIPTAQASGKLALPVGRLELAAHIEGFVPMKQAIVVSSGEISPFPTLVRFASRESSERIPDAKEPPQARASWVLPAALTSLGAIALGTGAILAYQFFSTKSEPQRYDVTFVSATK